MLSAMSFGTRLRTLREQKGLTQEGLGKGLGTAGADAGKAVVYGWEKDQHHPRVDQLMLICKRLGCSADYLLFGTESNLTQEALLIARWFDRLTDPRDRAVAETGAMGVILRVLQRHDLPPIEPPEHDSEPGTPRAPAKPPAPTPRPKPAKKQTN